jgi:CubicO group peptidase (beta-lactamase class C family)
LTLISRWKTEDSVFFVGRLNQVIDRALTQSRIVGTAILVVRDGSVAFSRVAGSADRESGQPVQEDTIFRLASMTKPIVSVATLALVEQDKIHLDDPVTRWLPDFRPALSDGRRPTITVRHLLTHTAGLNYGFKEPADGPYHRAHISDGLEQPGLPIEENLRRLASVDPVARLSVVALTNTAVAGMTGDFPDAVIRAVYGG